MESKDWQIYKIVCDNIYKKKVLLTYNQNVKTYFHFRICHWKFSQTSISARPPYVYSVLHTQTSTNRASSADIEFGRYSLWMQIGVHFRFVFDSNKSVPGRLPWRQIVVNVQYWMYIEIMNIFAEHILWNCIIANQSIKIVLFNLYLIYIIYHNHKWDSI